MTPRAWALLTAVVIVLPFLALQPHATQAEHRDYVREVVCAPQYFWDCATAQSIVWRESGNESSAVNPSSLCAGWWQIHPVHGYSVAALMDPVFNTRVAYQLWLTQGFGPWQ